KRVVVYEDVIRKDLRLDDADGVDSKRTTWNEFSCSMASAIICLATVIINAQVDDLSSHNNQYTSPALTQKVFANMRIVGKGFSRVDTPLFATMLVQPQPSIAEEEDEGEEQETDTSESSMTLLNTLTETCTTLSQKVAQLEQDKVAQALEILKLNKRVKKLEKQRRMHSNRGKIAEIDADEDITLVDIETQVDLEQAAAREKQEKADLEKAKGLQ
nr:hypothetical protein [Tanacetum cinerariifolium]